MKIFLAGENGKSRILRHLLLENRTEQNRTEQNRAAMRIYLAGDTYNIKSDRQTDRQTDRRAEFMRFVNE